MLTPGQTIATASGLRLQVTSLLGNGAEGHTFLVNARGDQRVLKIFTDPGARDTRLTRTRFLLGQRLSSACQAVIAPIDVVDSPQGYGHVQPYAAGTPLEEFLEHAAPSLVDTIQVSLVLSHAVRVLHDAGIAHGDLHSRNVLVGRQGEAWLVSLIDLDGFSAAGFPSPVAGHMLYMAPEVSRALADSRPVDITPTTDAFSLAVLLHEILLWKHVSAGQPNEDAERGAMYGGRWIFDPASGTGPRDLGLPSAALSMRLQGLFRRAFGRDSSERPSAVEWHSALAEALWAVWRCPDCSGEVVIDRAKSKCPYCTRSYPALALHTSGGPMIPLTAGQVSIGRKTFGNIGTVSATHATIDRSGPEYWITDHSTNGTFRLWPDGQWKALPKNVRVVLRPGDRLRFGGVEAQLRAMR